MPFWCYYGGKFRVAVDYPHPEHNTIIEPFAGAAGYSTRFPDRKVLLFDKDPIIAGLWRWLIHVTPRDVRALPLGVERTEDLKISQEAKWLIGFWLHKATTQPGNASSWMKSGVRPKSHWSWFVRERIARQVDRIRHWQIKQASYEDAPNIKATWFIDPPYQVAGRLYRCGSKDINYAELGVFCTTRKGTTIVCENEGAAWLPFRPFRSIKSAYKEGSSKEVVFIRRESKEPPPGMLL